MSKTKLALAEKAAPQKTDAERLDHIGTNLNMMSVRLGELAEHLTDLGNLIYERQDSGKPVSRGILQAASTLLSEYSDTVEDFETWASELAAEAEGTDQK